MLKGPPKLVRCEVCNKELLSLPAHIKTMHDLSVAQYRDRFGKDIPLGQTITTRNAAIAAAKESASSPEGGGETQQGYDPMEAILGGLSGAERAMYDVRFAILFKQSQDDPMFESTVRSVALNEIFLLRVQNQLHALTNNGKKPNAEIIRPLIDSAEKIQKLILSSLQSLNATKKDRDALNKSPETTASRLITAFALTQHAMNEFERTRFQKDNAEAMARLNKNRNDLLKLLPSESPDEEVEIKGLNIDPEEYE